MSDTTEPSYRPPRSFDRGRYTVESVLGTGGTATVVLARDTRMNVNRAIKVLHPQFASSNSTRTRFMNEAQAQAQLKHPNVLMVHDVVEDPQGVYMVMELAEGGALGAQILAEGCFTARETADIGIHVGEALIVAHGAGLVHRDIKPANILADRHGVLKLADFGIARVRNTDHTLTRSGSIMGTWAFMPPEQREDSSSVDQRSDIYAFGVTLYALLTGRGSSRLHNQEAWTEAYAGVPDGLARIIQRATRLFPEDRYPAMTEMVADLRAWRFSAEGSGPGWGDATEVMHHPKGAETAVRDRSDASQHAVPSNQPPFETSAAAADVPVPTPHAAEHAFDPATAPASGTAPLSLMTLAGIAGGGMVVAAMLGIILVLLADRAQQQPPSESVSDPAVNAATVAPSPATTIPTAAAPETDPAPPPKVAPEAGSETTPASTPAPKPSPKPEASPAPKRRVIQVIQPASGNAGSTPSAAPKAPDETGKLNVRTIPSGARVTVGGRQPSRSGGAYVLPIGTHTVMLESAGGERHSVPVTIRAGRSIDICYSFDSNSACEGTP